MPKLPDVIGRFKIVDQIARGGMGALYLAWDPTLERQIAIKLLRDDSDELRERFSREARFVARLRHPRIVTVFDVGEHDGQPFIAMEYVQGNTLADIVRAATPLPIGVKLKWIEELCDGLSFAHRAGIVHRDVKPANMIVDAEGSIKILDFGIARDGPGRTQAGMLIGSLNYMSPEQVLGRPVDQRSDVFAVGGVLYELLTYRQAFSGGLDSGILAKILHEAPEPLPSLQPELDRDVARIVERALQKDPAKRYQEIQGMQRDLLRVLRELDASETKLDSDMTAVLLPPVPLRSISPPRTGRREPDRAALERRRAEQIQAHLDAARAAMSARDYEDAIAACEQALLLDSLHPTATELLEHAIVALDARRASEFVAEAQRQLDAGALTSAMALVQQALDLGETSTTTFQLRDAIDRARTDRERERRRLEDGQKAAERARRLFEGGSFDEAVRAADEALTLVPEDVSALAVKQRAIAAGEARHVELLNERARTTTAEAQRLFGAGKHGEALHLLEGFNPRPHADIERTLDDLATRLRAIEQEIEEHLAEASAACALHDLEKAAAIIGEALALEPTHQRARAMQQEILAAIHEDAERREAGRKAVERAWRLFEAGSFDEAVRAADEALTLVPEDVSALEVKQRAVAAAEARRVELLNERARTTTAEARRLFARGKHVEALNLLERFDPRPHADIERALDELGTMLKAIERQVEEYLAEASAALSAHNLDKAAISVREAVALQPAHERARAMEQEISAAIQEDAKRREAGRRAVERARRLFEAGSLEDAARAADEALTILPGDATALAVKQRAIAAAEAQRVERLNERVRNATAEARRLFAAGEHAEALHLLERFDPRHHPEIARTFDELQAMLETIERQVEEYLAEASAALSAHNLDKAAASVREAVALQPAHDRARAMAQEISDAIREEAKQREIEQRLERERRLAIAAKLADAAQTISHQEALVLISAALELDAQNEEALRSFDIRSAALEQERAAQRRRNEIDGAYRRIEELLAGDDLDAVDEALKVAEDGNDARKALQPLRRQLASKRREIARRELAAIRQRERDQSVAEALDKASRAVAHEVAVAAYRQVLDLEPGHQAAQQGMKARQAALEKERLVAAALDRAAAAGSDSEAVIALREALELQPDLPDVLRQLNEREAAMARQQEEARQEQHDERPAEETAHHADMEDKVWPPERGAADSDDRIAGSSQESADDWLSFGSTVRRRAYIVGAVAAAILLIVVALAYGPDTSQPISPEAGNPAPSPPRVDPQPNTAPAPPVAPTPDPSPSPQADDPAVPQVDPVAELENRLSPIRVLARRQVQQGNHRQAVGTIMSGLKLQPDDAVLRRLLADITQNAIVAARVARDSALSAGTAAENLTTYKDGRVKEQEGLRLAARRPEVALPALWDAAGLYAQAIEELRKIKPQEPPPASPPPSAPAQPQSPPRKAETPAPVERPPVVQPPAPMQSTAADEAEILAVLRGYEQAYAARSVQDVKRVYPEINAEALAENFKRMRALSVEIINPKISIAASTATVVCQVRQRFTPDVGSGRQTTVNATFRLVKKGNAWVIVDRR